MDREQSTKKHANASTAIRQAHGNDNGGWTPQDRERPDHQHPPCCDMAFSPRRGASDREIAS